MTPEVAAQFRAMGVVVPQDRVARPTDLEIWPEHWDALLVFLDLETQWRPLVLPGPTGAVVAWLGLPYAEVEAAIRRRGLPAETFLAVQTMERAALSVLNERRGS